MIQLKHEIRIKRKSSHATLAGLSVQSLRRRFARFAVRLFARIVGTRLRESNWKRNEKSALRPPRVPPCPECAENRDPVRAFIEPRLLIPHATSTRWIPPAPSKFAAHSCYIRRFRKRHFRLIGFLHFAGALEYGPLLDNETIGNSRDIAVQLARG